MTVEDLTAFDVKILRLEPGDQIALQTEDMLTKEQAAMLKEHAEAAFVGHNVVVLSGGIEVVVIRPEPL